MVVEGEGYRLYRGDCLEVLRTFEDNTFDTVITDPPAGISFMGKDWDKDKGGRDQWIAWLTEVMSECLRVAKPGAMLLCWSIPRTSHWTGTAIEQAGWQVRDVITFLFGSGFPKSMAIDKAIDKAAGQENIIGYQPDRWTGKGNSLNFSTDRPQTQAKITAPATDAAKEWDGWGTALKPAAEFWWLAMKPIEGTFAENALAHGVAGLNIDGCRIEADQSYIDSGLKVASNKAQTIFGQTKGRNEQWHKRPGNTQGRWPANLILDEEAAAALDEMSGELKSGKPSAGHAPTTNGVYGKYAQRSLCGPGDAGGASRYFYTAKASRSERDAGLEGRNARNRDASRNADQPSMNGGEGNPYNRGAKPVVNHHPTVKPLDLMRYLVRLTKTPKGGTVLDPFMGSGSTGVACMIEGRQFVGIDREAEYVEIARHRLEHWRDEMSTEPRHITDTATHTDLPLFAEAGQ